jgi:hypothetical protein
VLERSRGAVALTTKILLKSFVTPFNLRPKIKVKVESIFALFFSPITMDTTLLEPTF